MTFLPLNWKKWAIFDFLMPSLAVESLKLPLKGSRHLCFDKLVVKPEEKCFEGFENG